MATTFRRGQPGTGRSEQIFEAELDNAWIHGQRTGDFPEGRRSNLERLRIDGTDAAGVRKLRVIEGVEELEAEDARFAAR